MQGSGFANAPLTRTLLLALIVTSILATATDTKHYLPLVPSVHLLPSSHGGTHTQYFRIATWQIAYLNSAELLFAILTLYKLRVIERLWGSRKFAAFLIVCFVYTATLPPLLLTFASLLLPIHIARTAVHLPAGPTALLFALLAQYHAAIPYTYRYKLATSSAVGQDGSEEAESEDSGVLLTSKSTSYLLPLQLALSQAPWSLVPALLGWCVGYAWRSEVLPGSAWRIPSRLGPFGYERARNLSEVGEMNVLRGRMRAEQGSHSR